MQFELPIQRWRGAILCALLCLGVHVRMAAADAATPKPGSSSSAHPASVKLTKQKHSTRSTSGKHSRGKSKGKRGRGQQAIDSPRAREIQQALIAQHYMEGEASGKWDDTTQDALRRYQAAQGWQTKTVPDSRALIKLGLGPSTEGLLNPDSAMTAVPPDVHPKTRSTRPTDEPSPRTPAVQDAPQR